MRLSRATILFAILFAGGLAASVLVLASRTPDLVLEVRRLPGVISPNDDDLCDTAEITFFVREDDSNAAVTIVGKNLALVRTLDAGASLEANKPVTYRWDGTDDAGGPAPVGRYRLRVELPASDRDMVFPRRMNLNRPPPRDDVATDDVRC
ncbi:MAG: FlgD immunoglobulin-like domain containing protein [Solirubrobacterales bacterium]